jgi:hypothetical protein
MYKGIAFALELILSHQAPKIYSLLSIYIIIEILFKMYIIHDLITYCFSKHL